MFSKETSKTLKTAMGIGALAFSAAVYYRVRELLAALILFSFLFAIVALAVLILWLAERGAHYAGLRLGDHMAPVPARHVVAPAQAGKHTHGSPPWNR